MSWTSPFSSVVFPFEAVEMSCTSGRIINVDRKEELFDGEVAGNQIKTTVDFYLVTKKFRDDIRVGNLFALHFGTVQFDTGVVAEVTFVELAEPPRRKRAATIAELNRK